jgi:tryptophanyl-tRNA synthetase
MKPPRPLIRDAGARIMGLDDPESKMSKSLAELRPGHAIGLLDDPETIRKSIMAAKTDCNSEIRCDTLAPGIRNLLTLYEVLSGEPRSAVEARFSGKRYGYLKKELAELSVEVLRPIRTNYGNVMEDPIHLETILIQGAARASTVAEVTLADVRARVGL